jgi:hypothetical protein
MVLIYVRYGLPVLTDDVGHGVVQAPGLSCAGLKGSLGVLDVIEG